MCRNSLHWRINCSSIRGGSGTGLISIKVRPNPHACHSREGGNPTENRFRIKPVPDLIGYPAWQGYTAAPGVSLSNVAAGDSFCSDPKGSAALSGPIPAGVLFPSCFEKVVLRGDVVSGFSQPDVIDRAELYSFPKTNLMNLLCAYCLISRTNRTNRTNWTNGTAILLKT